MKKIIVIIAAVAIAVLSYWSGYVKGKEESLEVSFADSLGLVQMLMSDGGLSENGKETLNQITDVWLYGYFSSSNFTQRKDLQERIESGLVAIIEWKRKNGYPVGHQKPLVGLKPVGEKAVTADKLNEELFTDPMVEHFEAYKERLNVFIDERGISIQPVVGGNAEPSAPRSTL